MNDSITRAQAELKAGSELPFQTPRKSILRAQCGVMWGTRLDGSRQDDEYEYKITYLPDVGQARMVSRGVK